MEVTSHEKQHKKAEITKTLLGRLRMRVPLYYPELADTEFSIKTVSLGGEYAQTFRFEVWAPGSKRVIFVKLCPVFEKLNPAVMEYATLQLLHARLPRFDERCAAARPLDFFEDLNGYAMESVGAKNFKPYLLKLNSRLSRRASLDELREKIAACGVWLKAFHDITKTTSLGCFRTHGFLAAIRDDFDYRKLEALGFKETTLKRLDAMFSSLARLDGFALPCAKWHWDYTPAHVFFDHGRISVIDITGLDAAPVYEDIGHFLAALVTVNNLPFYPFYDRRRADDVLGKIFMEAYCQHVPEADFVLFANVYKFKYLLLWFNAQHQRTHQLLPSFVAHIFSKYRLATLFEVPLLRAMDAIESALTEIHA